jgi:hypothetical protein
MKKFWIWLCRYAFAKVKAETVNGRLPDGLPGIRDVNARCDMYAPRKRSGIDGECWGDGHYLCKGCAHYTPNLVEEEDEV